MNTVLIPDLERILARMTTLLANSEFKHVFSLK